MLEFFHPFILSLVKLRSFSFAGCISPFFCFIFTKLNQNHFKLSSVRIKKNNRLIKDFYTFRNMTALHMLNLSGNPITSLPENLLTQLTKIKVLDLSNMKLEKLREGFIPRGVWPNTISLSDNPWKCSCDIMWITNMMR